MAKTDISWSENVWNPLTGCSKIGQGCKNCYAEKMAHRLRMMGKPNYRDATDDKGNWTGKITLIPEKIEEPLAIKKPTTFFVNSMSDLFHDHVPMSFIGSVFEIMSEANWHTFQVLTKRYENAASAADRYPPAPHIHIGFSVCNRKDASESVEHLSFIHDAGWFTWVSYEPALEEVNWSEFDFIDWLVCGGESGHGCRPFSWDWARDARNFCRAVGVPFFMKQGGGAKPPRGLTDFPEDLRIREFPRGA